MTRPGVLLGLVAGLLLLRPTVVSGQSRARAIFQAEADSLRAALSCDPPDQWPELPRRPKPVSIQAAVDSAGVVRYLSEGVVVSTRIDLPQYANFLDPTSSVCEPVVVLEEDGIGNFVYTRPFQKTAGTAPVVYFVLLGVEPAVRVAPDSADG